MRLNIKDTNTISRNHSLTLTNKLSGAQPLIAHTQ